MKFYQACYVYSSFFPITEDIRKLTCVAGRGAPWPVLTTEKICPLEQLTEDKNSNSSDGATITVAS